MLAKEADPERLIEAVTNGLDYRIQPGVARLVLVPSVIVRPWAVMDQHQDTLVVVFPVADEYIDLDPDAPAPWMVKVYKALAGASVCGSSAGWRKARRRSASSPRRSSWASRRSITTWACCEAGLVRIAIDKAAGSRPTACALR